MDPLLQGVFSDHRTVLAAVLCLEKGQRAHLVVEQHESCPGASWSPAAIWVFLPPTAWSDPQLQIHRPCPKSSHSKCQQGGCHPMSTWLEGTFGSHSVSHPPGWLPMLNHVCCGFVQQKFEPPPRMEVLPIPLVICPRAAHFPPDEIFPNIPRHNSQSLSQYQGEFGSAIFSAALQETGGYCHIYLLVMPVLCCWHKRCDTSQRRHQEDPAGGLWALSAPLSRSWQYLQTRHETSMPVGVLHNHVPWVRVPRARFCARNL